MDLINCNTTLEAQTKRNTIRGFTVGKAVFHDAVFSRRKIHAAPLWTFCFSAV